MVYKNLSRRAAGRTSIAAGAVAALMALPGVAPEAEAGPFSVQDELTVPSAPNARFTNQWIASQPITAQREMFAAPHAFQRSIDTGQTVIPLDFLDLPAEFGLVIDNSGDQVVYQGLTYIVTETTRIDASWGFGRTYQSLEGHVDLHFGF